MSNEENSNKPEAPNEVISDAVEAVEEVVEEVVDAVEEAVDEVSEAGAGVVAKVMALKDSNPKVFFGGIAGLVVVILLMMMGGDGGAKHLPVSKLVNLSIGQTYSLKGVNTYDPMATIRLVGVPGSLAAYDDSADKDSDKCKHMDQGTKVKLIQVQEAFGTAKFVEIEIVKGECAGRKGWVVANNLN